MGQVQAALAVVFALGRIHVIEIVGQAMRLAVLVQVLGTPVEQRRDLDEAVGVEAYWIHLRPHGRVGGAQGREPDLGGGLAQGPRERLELDLLRERGVAGVIQRGRGTVHRLAVGPRAQRQVDAQVEPELARHLVGKPVGGFGVVAVVHPYDRDVRPGTRAHVQDHGLERAEVGGDDGGLAQADGPVHEALRVVAEFGVDPVEVDGAAHGNAWLRCRAGWTKKSAGGRAGIVPRVRAAVPAAGHGHAGGRDAGRGILVINVNNSY